MAKASKHPSRFFCSMEPSSSERASLNREQRRLRRTGRSTSPSTKALQVAAKRRLSRIKRAERKGRAVRELKNVGTIPAGEKVSIEVGNLEQPPKPRRKSRIVERGYERKHKLVDLAKQRADYRCEVADCTVELFTKPDGQRYVEVHHLIGMAEGGPDTMENLVCVCANHHRELHYGNQRGELKAQLQLLRTEEGERK